MPLDTLDGWERKAVAWLDAVNLSPRRKRWGHAWVRDVTTRWVHLFTWRITRAHGLEHVERFEPPGAVILVSNHRTFWDMYITCKVLFRRSSWLSGARLHFPVRAEFFYTSPVGVLVNLLVSGGAMWPPVFRQRRRIRLNVVGLHQLEGVMETHDCAVVGIHPEGTRNKTDDPYTLLEPKPGTGKLIQDAPADTWVVPFFVTGMTNNLAWEFFRNYLPRSLRGPDIRITFGAPVAAAELAQVGNHREVTEALMQRIRELGEADRAREASTPNPN